MQRPAIILTVLIFIGGIAGSAYATTGEIMLSTPTIVDTSGHPKTEVHVGEPVGFSSVVTNHSSGEQRFTYVVRVLQNSQIQFQEALSANILPNQSFTVGESWTPQAAGSYVVQTFLLNGNIMSPPTNVIQTNITVK
ncbi:MAG: hypothetical protein ACREA3_06675 [Nitrosotalea sp.]